MKTEMYKEKTLFLTQDKISKYLFSHIYYLFLTLVVSQQDLIKSPTRIL